MRVDVLTLFPGGFAGPLDVSIIARAREAGLLDFRVHDIREHATDRHRSVDDYPFGGGQGMVLRVDVLDAALEHVRGQVGDRGEVIYLSPAGQRLDDALARKLAEEPRLILVCGRYEGVDERLIERCVDREVSIGDYVLAGGELPAMVLTEAVTRHLAGALGDEASSREDSFADGLLEHPQYTRPAEYRGSRAPAVLLGGDHTKIATWQREQRIARTRARRPDLLPAGVPVVDDEERKPRGAAARVRTFRYPEDYPAVRAIWEAAGPGVRLRPADEPLAIARKLERDPELFLVAESGKRVVGAVLGGFDGRRGFLYHLAVVPEFRRRGVASRLADEVERRLRLKGCARANLFIVEGNAEAEAFWEARGWRRMDAAGWAKDLD